MNPFGLKNEIALITGGGTGLGREIARCLATIGARVVIIGRRKDPLEMTCQEISDDAAWFTHDVTDFDSAPALIERIVSEIGAPTILINNAGVHLKKPATEITNSEFQKLLDTHLLGAMALTRAVAPTMIERNHGSILFISSMAAVFGIPYVAAYSAAKSAILGLVRALAVEFSPHNVRVNAIVPGWIESEMMLRAIGDDPERKARILSRTPMGRFGDADDIGWAASYLCSPAAKFVTGQQLVIDGGASIGF